MAEPFLSSLVVSLLQALLRELGHEEVSMLGASLRVEGSMVLGFGCRVRGLGFRV